MKDAELAPALLVSVERQGLWAIVRLTGDLDNDTCAELDDHLSKLTGGRDQPRIGIDVSGLEFCDSSGIVSLLRAWRAAHERGGSLVLVRPRDDLERRLDWLDPTDRLSIVDRTPW